MPPPVDHIVLIGEPNAGKSSLINRLLGSYQQIVTSRQHTTQYSQELTLPGLSQLALVDTPGTVPVRRRREHKRLHLQSQHALDQATLGIAVFEAKKVIRWARKAEQPTTMDLANRGPHPIDELVKTSANASCPVIAILNKVDLVSKREDLLEAAQALMFTGAFTDVVPVSCIRKRGTGSLVAYLANRTTDTAVQEHFNSLERSNDAEVVAEKPRLLETDTVFAERVREQCFKHLKGEVPYLTKVRIDKLTETDEKMQAWVTLGIARSSHKSIVLGTGGTMIKTIGTKARESLQRYYDKKVDLMLQIKTEKSNARSQEWK